MEIFRRHGCRDPLGGCCIFLRESQKPRKKQGHEMHLLLTVDDLAPSMSHLELSS